MRSKAFWVSIILLFQGSFLQRGLQEHHQGLGQGWKSILVEGLRHLPRQLVPSYELGLLKVQWCSSQLDLRGKYNLNVLGFREQENSPLDVQFGPSDLLRADAYILAVINNQYLDDLAELNS